MTKFVTYTRVSTREQGKSGLGLEAQTALLEHYLDGYEVIGSFTEVASAGSVDRTEMQKAVQMCKDEGCHLAVAKVDRLSRVTEQALKVWSDLDGRLFCADLPMRPFDLTDKFVLTIFLAIADRERELIKIRTRQGLSAAKARGTVLGNPENLTDAARAAGAQSNRKNAIHGNRTATAHAKVLRESGLGLRTIARRLNEGGFKTRTGKLFQAMTVKRMLDRVPA